MRSLLLFLSGNRQLKAWTSRSRLAQVAARRFVSGESIEHAVAAIRAANQRGMTATLDHLGENTETEAQAVAAADLYLTALDRIAETGVQSHISLKLTQLGLDLGTEFCRDNVARVAGRAKQASLFMRIDMEGSDYVDRTLDVVFSLRDEYDNVGAVIQSYLYRSRSDIEALIEAGVPVRLCKGAYKEPPSLAFPKKAQVDQNTIDLMHLLLSEKALANGARLAMATHDEKMIAATQAFAAAHDIPQQAYEFQMLYGIRDRYQQRLADEGYGMRVYIPFGAEWYPYYMRRLAERPANVWFIISNLLRR
jgi:proline dehydrogenase